MSKKMNLYTAQIGACAVTPSMRARIDAIMHQRQRTWSEISRDAWAFYLSHVDGISVINDGITRNEEEEDDDQ